MSRFILQSVTNSLTLLHYPPLRKGHVPMPCNKGKENYWILKQNINHWVYSHYKEISTLNAATVRKLIKVHSKIKKQSLSSKQERELLFLVCLRQGEALLQLLVLELALLPLWSPLPQLLLMSRSRQLQYRLHT